MSGRRANVLHWDHTHAYWHAPVGSRIAAVSDRLIADWSAAARGACDIGIPPHGSSDRTEL